MEVTYTQIKEDLAAFRRFHARHRAKGRGLTLFLNGFLVLVWGLQLWLLARAISVWRLLLPMGPRGWEFFLQMHQHLLVNFVLLTLLLAYLFWGQKLLAELLLARQGQGAALFAQPKRLWIEPEGVDVSNTQEQVTRTWKDIPCRRLLASAAHRVFAERLGCAARKSGRCGLLLVPDHSRLWAECQQRSPYHCACADA